MNLTKIESSDPVVMAQQIQALIANVQELKKQNEDLKQKVRPEGTNKSQSRCNHNAMTMNPIVLEIAKEKLLSTLHSRFMAMIRRWKTWGRS